MVADNIYYTNIITIKNIIILVKNRKKEKLLESITDIIMPIKMAQTLSFVNIDWGYK